ncbi:MAG: TRAP transporter small permease [Thermodesulfobacteriota bacterium]
MQAAIRSAKRSISALGGLGALAMGFMVLSITYDVAMRYIFSRPTSWALEVNTFLLALLSVVPACEVLQTKSHIRVSFFRERLPELFSFPVALVRAAAGAFFCGVMTWKGILMAWQAWQHNDRMSTSLGTPMVIPYLFLPVGFGFLTLYFLASPWPKMKQYGKEQRQDPQGPS